MAFNRISQSLKQKKDLLASCRQEVLIFCQIGALSYASLMVTKTIGRRLVLL